MSKQFIKLDKKVPLTKFVETRSSGVKFITEEINGESMVAAVLAERSNISVAQLSDCRFLVLVNDGTTITLHTKLYNSITEIEKENMGMDYLIKEVIFM